MIKFTIYGELISLNDYIEASRGRSWYKSAKKKKEANEACEWAIRQQCKGKHIDKCDVAVHWIAPNRKKDHDNIAFGIKFILDALVNEKVLDNDGWENVGNISHTFDVDKNNPRIEVTLLERTS